MYDRHDDPFHRRGLPSLKKKDLVGTRVGMLTVVEEAGKNKWNYILWKCRCDCGNEKIVSSNDIVPRTVSGGRKQPRVFSCGCVRKPNNNKTGKHYVKRKLSPAELSHTAMITRCYNEKRVNYKYYGGRGITVCDRWRESFDNFLADMGERPEGTILDRIDPNGNYTPDNTTWSPRTLAQRNTRRFVDYTGQKTGDFTVIGLVSKEQREQGEGGWWCRCDKCGALYSKSVPSIKKNGRCMLCSQLQPGEKFGMLTVIEKSDAVVHTVKGLYLFECECGTRLLRPRWKVETGQITHCGCLKNKKYKTYL
jgi:hypothetical protein